MQPIPVHIRQDFLHPMPTTRANDQIDVRVCPNINQIRRPIKRWRKTVKPDAWSYLNPITRVSQRLNAPNELLPFIDTCRHHHANGLHG